MKKNHVFLLLIFIFTLLTNEKVVGQKMTDFQPQHEIRIGIGCKPFEAANISFGDAWFDFDYPIIDFNAKDYYSGARYTTNAIFGEYVYQANSWFGVGATLTYFSYFNNYYTAENDSYVGRNIINHFSVFPTLRFSWLKRPAFSMYTSLGLGMRFVSESDRIRNVETTDYRNGISGQFTLLGLTIGKKVYCFSDLSTIGTQGFITVGLGYRFVSFKR